MKDNYKNPAYAGRLATDRQFLVSSVSMGAGEPRRAVEFVTAHQLYNTRLWKLFAEQFRTRPDDADVGWRGEYWGKMLRGACFTYRLTRDERLYEVITDTVRDMLDTADPDGRISSYTRAAEFNGWDMWCRKYILLGFEYYMDICRDEALKARVLEAAKKHLDCIIAVIGEGAGRKSILATSSWWGCMNSCSILEPVVRLYNITKEQRYLDFAGYIVSTGGSNLGNVLELALKNEIPPYKYPVVKAYETMSFFEGVAEYYRVTGCEELKTAFLNFTDAVLATDYTIIGNCGCTHELFDNSAAAQTEPNEQVAQETCVSVTLSKLLYQALCLTGDPKYAEAMERTYYNSILGSINFAGNTYIGLDAPNGTPDYRLTDKFVEEIGGFTFDSYSPLYKSTRNRRCGGYKVMAGDTAYGCCACIGSAGTALMPLTAVMTNAEGIVINQYAAGDYTAEMPGGARASVAIDTQYPYEDSADITVRCEETRGMKLFLRVPSYSALVLDGREYAPGTYAEIEISGAETRIAVRFDISARTVTVNGRRAVEKGCIVYALDCRNADIDAVAGNAAIKEEPAPKDMDCRAPIDVTFDNGTKVRMTDYASAGAEWDKPGCIVTVWMDTAERPKA